MSLTGDSELVTDTWFAEVIVPVPIPKLFTYRIPRDFENSVSVGCRVIIQFGRKNIYTGIIAKIHHHPPKEYEARYILDVLDEIPHINQYQLKLFNWMSSYYMCTIGEVLNAALPSGLKLSSESFVEINPDFDFYESEYEFSQHEETVLDVLQREKTLSYSEIAGILNLKSYQNVIKSLLKKNAVIIFEKIKERYIPKKEKYVRIHPDIIRTEGALENVVNDLENKPKQQDILLSYLHHVPLLKDMSLNDKGISKKILFREDLSPSSFKTLVKNEVLQEYDVVVPRFGNTGSDGVLEIKLTELQSQVRKDILTHFESRQTVLLHGITGSGKTEVYIDIIKTVLEGGEQVLYMLPEIAITTQMVNRLYQVFGDQLGVYHSRYSDNERVEVWKGVLTGRFSLVLGVRSSVFLPFDNLGLIIVDEEHEASFKQFDPAPRYHARDVAQVLAQIHNAKVLMGSATPSIESYYLARSGKYSLVELDKRYGNAHLPQIKLADVRKNRKQQTLKNDFTSELFEQIGKATGEKEQVIIFRNRRGYSPHLTCEDCAWIPKCENCSVSLTYHMYKGILQCHYCGYKLKVLHTCPACGSARLKGVGFGTEKLEEDIKLFFPEANVRRMDLDTTRKKFSYHKIIEEFEKGDIDILVGTQMVTKGLDFDRVNLVGVMDADVMLHFPDFRSGERTFQVLTQVSGRAGRRDKTGQVIIQTSNTEQPVLEWVIKNDFESLYSYEIAERQKFRYPPFFRLIRIIVRHKEKDISERFAKHLGSLLKNKLGTNRVLDPHEPMISRIKNKYLMEILVKVKRDINKLRAVKEIISTSSKELLSQKEFKQVQVIFDVDPY